MAPQRRGFWDRLGSALQEGSASFYEQWPMMEDLRRRKLSDRQGFMRDIGGQIRTGWQTSGDLEPYILSAMQDYGMSREEAATTISQYLPTEEQRVAEIYKQLGTDATKWVPSVARRIAASVGLPNFGMSRRGLLADPLPLPDSAMMDVTPQLRQRGGLLERPLPSDPGTLRLQEDDFIQGRSLGAREFDPVSGEWSATGEEPPLTTERIMALLPRKPQLPPVADPLPLPEFVPGATGGSPLEWGGPQATLFEKQREEAIEAEKAQRGRERIYAGDIQRQESRIDLEMKQELLAGWSLILNQESEDETAREIEKLRTVLADKELQKLIAEDDEAAINRQFKVSLKLAAYQAKLTNQPVFHRAYNTETKKVTPYVVSFDPETETMVVQTIDDAIAAGLDPKIGTLIQDTVEHSPYYVENEGYFETLIQNYINDGVPPGEIVQKISDATGVTLENAQERLEGVLSQSRGGSRPPVTSDETERQIDKYLGGGDPRGDPQESRFLPLADFEEVLSQDRRVFGSRPSGPGQRQATINLGNILEGVPIRDLDNFLRTEGVQDWITAHTGGTSDVTEEMVKDMLNTREGLELLKKAFLERNDPIHDYPYGRETDLISR